MSSPDQFRAPDRRRRTRRRVTLAVVLAVAVLLTAWWTVSVFATDGWALSSGQLAWRFTARWAALIAAATVALVVVCVHWAMRLSAGTPEKPTAAELATLPDAERALRIREFRRSGLKGLVVGADGRASTSQLQVAIWTVVLVFGLLMLQLVDRTPDCPQAATNPHVGSCPANSLAGVSFVDLLGRHFPWEYLLLLGWPIALAVAAKQQVLKALSEIDAATGADADPTQPKAGSPEAVGADPRGQVKTPATDPDAIGILAGLRDVVADDHGRGALLDTQYFAFTLVTAGYFILQVVTHPAAGLPQIPAALLVLMGISGGGYLSGKVLDPVGAKSERGVPPPPATPATTAAPEPATPDRGTPPEWPPDLDKTTVIAVAGRDPETRPT
jgi:hypothetical protein